MINGEETYPQFKERILNVAKVIIENGLTIRNGQLKFGLREDMPKALLALKSVQNESDSIRMHDADDDLLKKAALFIDAYALSQAPFEKNQGIAIELNGKNAAIEFKKMSDLRLPSIGVSLKQLMDAGFEKSVQPRRWDNCGGFGQGPATCHDPYREIIPQMRRDREARHGDLHLGLGSK